MLPLTSIASKQPDDRLAPRRPVHGAAGLRIGDAVLRHVLRDPDRLLLGGGEHHGDRLADIADQVDRKERLVEAHPLQVDAAVLDVLARDEVDERTGA